MHHVSGHLDQESEKNHRGAPVEIVLFLFCGLVYYGRHNHKLKADP